jgi:hypothetical protein
MQGRPRAGGGELGALTVLPLCLKILLTPLLWVSADGLPLRLCGTLRLSHPLRVLQHCVQFEITE